MSTDDISERTAGEPWQPTPVTQSPSSPQPEPRFAGSEPADLPQASVSPPGVAQGRHRVGTAGALHRTRPRPPSVPGWTLSVPAFLVVSVALTLLVGRVLTPWVLSGTPVTSLNSAAKTIAEMYFGATFVAAAISGAAGAWQSGRIDRRISVRVLHGIAGPVVTVSLLVAVARIAHLPLASKPTEVNAITALMGTLIASAIVATVQRHPPTSGGDFEPSLFPSPTPSARTESAVPSPARSAMMGLLLLGSNLPSVMSTRPVSAPVAAVLTSAQRHRWRRLFTRGNRRQRCGQLDALQHRSWRGVRLQPTEAGEQTLGG